MSVVTQSLRNSVSALTRDQLKASILDFLETVEFPIASWGKGAVIRTIVAAFSSVLSPLTSVQVLIAESGFLDWASGDMLKFLAAQTYGVIVPAGTFAPGVVTLDNASGGEYPYNALEFRVFNPDTSKYYRNVAAFTLLGMQTGLEVEIEAVDIGTASTSAAGTITELETSLIGVTCTNAAAVIGTDPPGDVEIRELCRLQIAIASPNGPADAYNYVLKSSALNGGVVVTRTRPEPDSDTGAWTTYVAGPSGPIGGSDLLLLQDAIDRLCTPLGFDMTVASAVELVLNVGVTVYVYTKQGVDSDELEAAVLAAFIAYVPALPIGGDRILSASGYVFMNALEAVAKGAIPASMAVAPAFTAFLDLPVADVAVDPDEVVSLGTVNIVVSQRAG